MLVWLVWLAALILAIKNWSRHPRASLLLTVGLAIFFLGSAGSLGINIFLPRLLDQGGMSGSSFGRIFFVINILRSLVNAIAFGFVLAAFFADRRTAP